MFFALLRRANVLPPSEGHNPSKHLCRNDITFHPWGMMLRIKWTKTIQFKERCLDIPIARFTGNPLCPVTATFHAFSATQGAPSCGPAFVLPFGNSFKPLLASKFVRRIRQLLVVCNVNPTSFSGHSFRRGGATWAYQVGIPVDMIRILGDWKSNAYTHYIKPAPSSLLNASVSMGEGTKSLLPPTSS